MVEVSQEAPVESTQINILQKRTQALTELSTVGARPPDEIRFRRSMIPGVEMAERVMRIMYAHDRGFIVTHRRRYWIGLSAWGNR